MPELAELVSGEMARTIQDLKVQYRSLGLKASGSYEQSLEQYVIQQGVSLRAGIKGAEHANFMEFGRGPNKRQDRGMIAFIYVKLLEWMKVKGVTDINPWLAARKIVREGIKVPNKNNAGGAISGVINDKWFDNLQVKILDVQNENFIDAILTDLKQIPA